MSDWEGRLKAVASLAQPPTYQDGEIECLNPTCRNAKLNRADRNCWKCGLDRFAPASEEMRHALRFNYVPPPVMESVSADGFRLGPGIGIYAGKVQPEFEPDPEWQAYILRGDPDYRGTSDEISRRWRFWRHAERNRG